MIDNERQPSETGLPAVRAGEWIDATEFRQSAIERLGGGASTQDPGGSTDITIDLSEVDYLDGAALQVLVAIQSEQKRRGRSLRLIHCSEQLQSWFAYAGAEDLLDAGSRPAAVS